MIYNFSKSPVDLARLEKEIRSSAIVTALDYASFLAPNNLSVNFKTNLSVQDEELLNAIVVAHTGDPLVENAIQEVVTQLEKDDKTLGLTSGEASFNGNICVVEIPIPGTVGEVGRFVKEGYAFSDFYNFGMRVEKVELVDKNYLYAGMEGFYAATPELQGIPGTEGLTWAQVQPDGVVLGEYHDPAVPQINQGWRMWAEEGGQGGVDIDNLAGYGDLYSGAFLRCTFTKPEGGLATKIAVNIQWGLPK